MLFANYGLELLNNSDKSCDEILRCDFDLILGDGLNPQFVMDVEHANWFNVD